MSDSELCKEEIEYMVSKQEYMALKAKYIQLEMEHEKLRIENEKLFGTVFKQVAAMVPAILPAVFGPVLGAGAEPKPTDVEIASKLYPPATTSESEPEGGKKKRARGK